MRPSWWESPPSRSSVKNFDSANTKEGLKIALISLDQAWEDKARNLARCEELVAVAARGGAEILIFPEMTLTGFTMNTELSAEAPDASASWVAFSAMAARHRLWVLAGVVLRQGGKAANTLLVFSPDGREASRYVKLHPFSPSGEDRWFEAGNALTRVHIGEFTVGLTICYDLRFPELYSALATDCDLLVNIANWPQRRVAHWRTLLKARAIENQVFIVGVNRTGTDGKGLAYERSSGVVNANGEQLVPTLTAGEIDWYDVRRQDLLDFRAGFSTRQDRRPHLYRGII